jgi:hypothetical protein
MTSPTTGLEIALVPIVGLAVYVLAHIVCVRYVVRRSPHLALACGFVVGGALVIVWLLTLDRLASADQLARAAVAISTYVAFGYGYFAFANLSITSLRIRLLQEVAEAIDRIDARDVLSSYNADTVLAARLERLVAGQQIRESNGRYTADRPTLLWLGRLIDGLRALVFGRGHRP